jgi:hypothetical protein
MKPAPQLLELLQVRPCPGKGNGPGASRKVAREAATMRKLYLSLALIVTLAVAALTPASAEAQLFRRYYGYYPSYYYPSYSYSYYYPAYSYYTPYAYSYYTPYAYSYYRPYAYSYYTPSTYYRPYAYSYYTPAYTSYYYPRMYYYGY